MRGVDRRHIGSINQRHITTESLDEAITAIINGYNEFLLPSMWGSGESASADGTKWDIYEQNLLSEYHIRYGGYGGIGYYHVSDTYIALFSHFIPCGVWEAVYILDGLLKNKSDIQPHSLHSDTQGQSAPVFGLAYLLGIKLMPRIRNWKDLQFFRPDKETTYTHLEGLFSEAVNWDLISQHMDDMLRVTVSIKAGRLTSSTLSAKAWHLQPQESFVPGVSGTWQGCQDIIPARLYQ
jgi:TnpA family transposase